MANRRLNGEGTIYQRKNGLWVGEITLGYDADNKRNKKTYSSMDIDVLRRKMDTAKYKYMNGQLNKNNDWTVGQWVNTWLNTYKSETLKPSTYDNYYYAINNYIIPNFGSIKLHKLQPTAIQNLYSNLSKKNLSSSTIKKIHIALNQALEHAIKIDILNVNPCKGCILPKTEPKKVIAMTIDEQKAFTNACPDTTYGRLFIFALNTGMRIGEILALTSDDIDLKNDIIHVNKTVGRVNDYSDSEQKTKLVVNSTKTKSGIRSVPMNKNAKNIILKQLENNDGIVFASKTGTILHHRNVRRSLQLVLTKANIENPITIHALRHTFATRLLEKGANIKVVSDILGHKSIQITLDTYSHVLPNLKSETILLIDEL